MAPRQNTPKSKKDKFIKSKIICQRLLTCKCALGLGTVTTDKKKKHTKVMIPVHHNNTKIHGPMGEIKENYRLTCWWWGSNFLHEIKKKSCPFKLSPSSFKDLEHLSTDLEICLLLCILLILKTTLSHPQIHNDT